MRTLFLIASDGAVFDRNTNRLTIFNILEDIQSSGFPIFIQRLHLTGMFVREESEPETPEVFVLCTLNGEQLFQVPFPVTFQGRLRARGSTEYQGVVIPGPGQVRFELKQGNEVLAYWTLSVAITAPPQPEAVVAPGA